MEHMVVVMVVAQDLVLEVMAQVAVVQVDIPDQAALVQVVAVEVLRELRVQAEPVVQVVQVTVEVVVAVLVCTVKEVMEPVDLVGLAIMVVRADQVAVMAVQDHKTISLTWVAQAEHMVAVEAVVQMARELRLLVV